jgi:hypothetical protein
MTREEAIAVIEAHYPADDPDEDTAVTGGRLLAVARAMCQGWRFESTEVLRAYAELCQREHERRMRGEKDSRMG